MKMECCLGCVQSPHEMSAPVCSFTRAASRFCNKPRFVSRLAGCGCGRGPDLTAQTSQQKLLLFGIQQVFFFFFSRGQLCFFFLVTVFFMSRWGRGEAAGRTGECDEESDSEWFFLMWLLEGIAGWGRQHRYLLTDVASVLRVVPPNKMRMNWCRWVFFLPSLYLLRLWRETKKKCHKRMPFDNWHASGMLECCKKNKQKKNFKT